MRNTCLNKKKYEIWRGSPTVTKPDEFRNLLKFLKPTKKDVYYDLGCGYGNTCRQISKKVERSVGVEDKPFRFKKALRLTPESRYPNVTFMRRDFFKVPLKDATIIYCTQELRFSDLAKFSKKIKRGTRFIVPTLPPSYPIKSKRAGQFFIFKKPYTRVRNEDEYAQIYSNNKNAIMKEMYQDIGRKETKHLQWNISHAESNWNKFFWKR